MKPADLDLVFSKKYKSRISRTRVNQKLFGNEKLDAMQCHNYNLTIFLKLGLQKVSKYNVSIWLFF